MRLDVYLTENGTYRSRNRSAEAIKAGCVSLDGKVIDRPAFDLDGIDTNLLRCLPDPLIYVSRGALKLEHALGVFGIALEGKQCVDLGASTGGFTEVMLRRGAACVTAVDVGHGQLAPSLAADPRVVNVEGTDARDFSPGTEFDFVSMDVSFISAALMRTKIYELLKRSGDAVILFKPQFEVGRGGLNKHGVVKSQALAAEAMAKLTQLYRDCGLELRGQTVSPVKGGDGNTEYLLHFVKAGV